MKLTFSNSATSKQLLIGKENLEFFQKIKSEQIPLDLKLYGKTTENVLDNKTIDEQCPDITKLGNLKDELIEEVCKDKTIKVKKITIELECI